MKLLSAIILFMLSSISAAKEIIIVTDVHGSPIAEAAVTAMSYSINMKSVYTNAKGEAVLKSNIQGLKWISVEKEEYEPSHVQVSGEWPLYVQLQKQI
ncbi:carboxypeptidase-like regulatory domain-containing protein [Alkalimarinus sediminis]|uniref:Carboxypeptidase-like regulatory domain-containing protein n=1 Tax=Alkalimarinus sediminis TaxID=1632866 RepID=A0A9E8HHG4_9ALTE|nr:carboxypeptidase-like regulatory domain-containing protein [Alkalimarinus sediminis]UZW74499.1 carboxypeptidase-like regulatory domain-containing protein [Alkalimarinus sediminis]